MKPMKSLVAALVLPLIACGIDPFVTSAEADAAALQRQLDIMAEASASDGDLCRKAREVADAWLAAERVIEYRMADVEAGLLCNQARLANL